MEANTKSPLNRDLQRKILFGLRELMPFGSTDVPVDLGLTDISKKTLLINLIYLAEHDLIDHGHVRQDYLDTDSQYLQTRAAVITAQGMDFLENDGGLSAILGVVTVKFHDDTLKQLIEAKILQSDLSQPDKKRWIDQLRELPAETTKHLVLKLVDKGLEHAPAALPLIGSALGMSL